MATNLRSQHQPMNIIASALRPSPRQEWPGTLPTAPHAPYGTSTPLRVPARSNVQPPSHSLCSCSGPAGPLLAPLKSVAAVLAFRSGDQRLISRDAGPTRQRRVSCSAGRPAGPMGRRWLAPVLSSEWRANCGHDCAAKAAGREPRSAARTRRPRFPPSQASRRRDGIGPMFAQSDVARKWLVGPIVVLGSQRTTDARGIAFSAPLMGSARRERRDMIFA
jgi:hypothetical protein